MIRNARRRARLGGRTRADQFAEARWFRGSWLGQSGPHLRLAQPSRWRTHRTECAIGRVSTPSVHDDAAYTPQALCWTTRADRRSNKARMHKILQTGCFVYWIQFPVRAWQSPRPNCARSPRLQRVAARPRTDGWVSCLELDPSARAAQTSMTTLPRGWPFSK
jgi:hypothetical protein